MADAEGAGAQSLYAAGGTEGSRVGRFYLEHERALVGTGAVAAFFLAWETVTRSGLVDPLFLSSPTLIGRAAYQLFAEGSIWKDLRVSGTEFLVGYLLAAGLAIPLGLAVGWYRRLYFCLSPFIDVLNAVPRVALLPIIIIWFGIGVWSKIVVVFLGAVIPMLINTFSGVKTTEERFLKVARSFGASEFKIFWSIVFPGTVPFIFTGLKYAAGRALLGVVVGELYAATAGIGFLITVAGATFQTDKVFVGILIITTTGVLAVELLNRLERRFEGWRPKVGSAT
jgi:ABC-type nitrate/sulfonate/bicarbonate transport system permease component